MNRAQLAYTMLKEKGTVRMGDIPQGGPLNRYLARNAFAEAKALAAADGYVITHTNGKTFLENAYTLQALQKIEVGVEPSKQMAWGFHQ